MAILTGPEGHKLRNFASCRLLENAISKVRYLEPLKWQHLTKNISEGETWKLLDQNMA